MTMQKIVLTTHNESQTLLLMQLAKELHLKVELIGDDADEHHALMRLAEKSFAKEWDSPEDEHWDEFLKNAEDVRKR